MSHHDDTDADADPADDVQFVVEHLVDGGRTALIERHDVTAPRIQCSILTAHYTGMYYHRISVCCVTVVMRASSPSFLGQISRAASITVPVGPQQFNWRETNNETLVPPRHQSNQ